MPDEETCWSRVRIPPGPPLVEPSNSACLTACSSKPVSLDSYVSSSIISFVLWMRKKPYSEATVKSTVACIKSIARQANPNDPESVTEYVIKSRVSQNRKCVLADAIVRFYNFKQTPFQKPIYRKILRLPFIPLESEIDDLISGTNKKVSTAFHSDSDLLS